MKDRKRYYTVKHGLDTDEVFLKMIKKAIAIAREDKAKRIAFLTSGLNNTGWLERALGRDDTKKIRQGHVWDGIMVKHESLNNYHSQDGEIVMCLGIGSDNILGIEDNYDIKAIFSLPWTPKDVEKWAKITGAINIETDTTAEPYNQPPCVVVKALEELSEAINMSTGLSHSSDEDKAKTYLRALSKFGYDLNSLQIESFMFNQLDWSKDNLDEFIEIIDRINAGRSFKGGDKTGLKSWVNRWLAECDE